MVNKFKQRLGSRTQVMHGTAKMTSGGLIKKQLKYNKRGKIVSIKLSNISKINNNLYSGKILKKINKKGGSLLNNNNNNKKDDSLLNILLKYDKIFKIYDTKGNLVLSVSDNYITVYNNGVNISVPTSLINIKEINNLKLLKTNPINSINPIGGSLMLISGALSFFQGLYFTYKNIDKILYFVLTKFKISAKFIKLLINIKLQNSIPKKLLLSIFQKRKYKKLSDTELNTILKNDYITCFRHGICRLYNPNRYYIDTYKLYIINNNYIFEFTNSLNEICKIKYIWDPITKKFIIQIYNFGISTEQCDNNFLQNIDNLKVHLLINGSSKAIYLKYDDLEYIFVDNFTDKFLFNKESISQERILPKILDVLLVDHIQNRSTIHNNSNNSNNSNNKYTLPPEIHDRYKINNCLETMGLEDLIKYSKSELQNKSSCIKKKYKDLVKIFHPNKGGTTEKTQELNECYEKIKNYLKIK